MASHSHSQSLPGSPLQPRRRQPHQRCERDNRHHGNGLPPQKACRSVHRSVEISFPLQICSSRAARFGPGTPGTLHNELFAGQGVKRKTRRHLGEARDASGDDHELHHCQGQQAPQTGHRIIQSGNLRQSHRQVAGVAAGHHQPSNRQGQQHSRQAGEHDHTGKSRKLDRPGRENGHQQQAGSSGQVGCQQQVHHQRRQRHHQ